MSQIMLAQTRTQRRVADMRRTLIDVAETLLNEDGREALSAEEVARRADVAVQTVYNRVGGKPALLLAVAERAMEENRRYIDVAYSAPGSALERSRLIFAAYVRFALDRPQQFRTLVSQHAGSDAASRVAAMLTEQTAKLTAIIRDGIDQETFAPDLDPEITAQALWSMLTGTLMLILNTNGLQTKAIDADALVGATQRILEHGILRVPETAVFAGKSDGSWRIDGD